MTALTRRRSIRLRNFMRLVVPVLAAAILFVGMLKIALGVFGQ